MAYEAFAGVYDAFNEDADYDALFRYVCGVLRAHGVEDGIVADLGCGTGELTLRLAAAGYDMIGVDLSPEMLSVLREKAWETGQEGLLLLCQDIAELDLYGTGCRVHIRYVQSHRACRKIPAGLVPRCSVCGAGRTGAF